MTESKAHKKRKKRRRILSVFPILYPSKIGTPYSYAPGSANDSGGTPAAPPAPAPGPGMGERLNIKPSRVRVLHEMRRSLGLVEYFNDAPNVSMGGYQLPSFSSVPMRVGGPAISGPGFQHDGNEKAGRYDFKKSPGLGFRTEMAWRVWEKAIEVMDKEKGMAKHSILLRAMSKAGIHRGQMDPAEYRLLEMGIEWYLSDAGALGAIKGIFY